MHQKLSGAPLARGSTMVVLRAPAGALGRTDRATERMEFTHQLAVRPDRLDGHVLASHQLHAGDLGKYLGLLVEFALAESRLILGGESS